MSVRFLIIYRLNGLENQAPRPDWYSKSLCLSSFRTALSALCGINATTILMLDNEGSIPKDLRIEIRKMETVGAEFIAAPATGNCGSYLCCLDIVAACSNQYDLVLFAEDDYLWRENSISFLAKAFAEVPQADYITPYDHPARYDSSFGDIPHWNHDSYYVGSVLFRPHESTCMTFSVRTRVLIEDLGIHQSYSLANRKSPRDRDLFRSLQYLGTCSPRPEKRRLLLGPTPSLATHSHLPFLAPGLDWARIAYCVT